MLLRSFPSRSSIWIVLLAFVVMLAGCGGKGGGRKGGPSDGGGNGGGTSVSAQQRQAAIQATEAACRELSGQNLSPAAFDEALKNQMLANPAYKSVGVDPDSHTVWGVFADGRIHMVANNYKPDKTGSGAGFAAGRAVYLPQSKKARLMHSFGTNFVGQAPVADASQWLGANGYAIQPNAEGDASLDVLRNINGLGFFYINTHGGRVKLTNAEMDTYGIQSSTIFSLFREDTPAIKDDLQNGRLAYMTARNGDTILGGLIDDWDTRYAVTAAFVDKYWSFSKNSVVWINACYSGYAESANGVGGFVFACHKKGAGVYFGWNQLLGADRAFHSIRYFTDRLLGANEFEPENPKQRPFDWQEVVADMHKKGYDQDETTGAQLIPFANAADKTPEILAPTIERMIVDERQDRLILLGGFGEKEGTAKIDNTPVDVASWTNERIELELPQDGAGSTGGVQVEVDDHKSNVRNLTTWRFTIPYEYSLPGLTGLKVSGPVKLRFRGDVGAYRTKPGEAPKTHELWAMATRDSVAEWTGSGTFTSGDASVTWSGQRNFKPREYGPLDYFMVARLYVDPETKTGKLGLSIGTAPGTGLFTQIARGPGGTHESQFAAIFGPLEGSKWFDDPVEGSGIPAAPFPILDVTFKDDWSLKSKLFLDMLQVRLTVPNAQADFPPTGDYARSR
ncbi:hypothetical protein EON82_14730 [bacterium]|nr:MAG: hypothetical protein EON82_14730 [bacterium]